MGRLLKKIVVEIALEAALQGGRRLLAWMRKEPRQKKLEPTKSEEETDETLAFETKTRS